MKKLSLFLLVFIFVFTTGILVQAYDTTKVTNDLNLAKEIELENGQKIIELSDGRIAPVKEAKQLLENDLDTILKKMNFSEKDLLELNVDTKKDIVSNGGIKVDTVSSSISHSFTLDGKNYTVEGSNLEEVNSKTTKLIQEKIGNNSIHTESTVLAGGGTPDVNDGKFHMSTYAIYMGKSDLGTEYRYDLYIEFDWDSEPLAPYRDTFGILWSNKGERDANLSYSHVYGGTEKINNEIYSSIWSFWHPRLAISNPYPMHGTGKESVFIPIEGNTNTRFNFSCAYQHNQLAVPMSLSIGAAGWDLDKIFVDIWYHDETIIMKEY